MHFNCQRPGLVFARPRLRRGARLVPLVLAAIAAASSFHASPALALPCPFVVDPGGGGTHTTIQAAVNALPDPGPCTVIVRAGTYNESVAIASRNTLAVSDAQRIVIEADPAAVADTVIVNPLGAFNAFAFSRSRFITIKGFNITGASRFAVVFGATIDGNTDITIDSNHIHDNAVGNTSDGGIGIANLNPRTWVVNNLINNNGRNAIALGISGSTSNGFPKYFVNNTIVANKWNGFTCPAEETVYFVNNLVVGNGTAVGTTGGRFGIVSSSTAVPANQVLVGNVFYKNGNASGGGDIASGILDATDSGNRTTFGTELPAGAIAGCTFGDCLNTHAFTEIFVSATDFHLRASGPASPAIDTGVNSFSNGGKEWVPGVDFEGTPRPQGVADDAGYDELGAVPATPTPTNTPTLTPTPTVTPTGPIPTPTPTNTPTLTPTPTVTPTGPIPTPTSTPTATPTSTPTSTPTVTPTTAPGGGADLAVTKAGVPNPVQVGDLLTYTITVTNNGPATATGIQMSDTLPAGVVLGSVSTSQGICATAGLAVSCDVGTLLSGQSATILIDAGPTVPGTINNTTAAVANEPDPSPGNNSSTAATDVLPEGGTSVDVPALSTWALPALGLVLAAVGILLARGRFTTGI